MTTMIACRWRTGKYDCCSYPINVWHPHREDPVSSPTLAALVQSWNIVNAIVNPESVFLNSFLEHDLKRDFICSHRPEKVQLCTICCDPIDGPVIQVPCGHAYDKECLESLFRKATTDESLFPPRCCVTEIPLNIVRQHFDRSVVSAFESKSVEFSTKDRVYCYRSICSAFLGSATSTSTAMKCHSCASVTCGSCKEELRIPGHICIPRIEQEVAHLAQEQQWQRCPDCHHLVELNQGCFHITCVCGKQFCYLCAAPWKECDCPQFPHQGQDF